MKTLLIALLIMLLLPVNAELCLSTVVIDVDPIAAVLRFPVVDGIKVTG